MNEFNWELLTHLSTPNKVSWADLVFLSEAEREDFCNVNMVTLKAHYYDLVCELAFNRALASENTSSLFTLADNEMKKIFESGEVNVRQFIEYDGADELTICLNRDKLDDIAVVDFLLQFDWIYGFEKGRREFGHTFTFTQEELNLPFKTGMIHQTLGEQKEC